MCTATSNTSNTSLYHVFQLLLSECWVCWQESTKQAGLWVLYNIYKWNCPESVGSKCLRGMPSVCRIEVNQILRSVVSNAIASVLTVEVAIDERTSNKATKQQSNSQTLLRLRDGTISIARLILRFPLLRRYVLILANKSNYTQSSRSNKHINYIWSYYQSITGLVALNSHVESYIILFVPGLCCMPCLCLTI